MKLAGRSAIVTGGAGGLGAATVGRLVDCALRVVILDRAGPTVDADAAVSFVEGDVNDDDAVLAAVEAAQALGPLSVLVNVAGGAVGGGPLVGADGVPHDRRSFERTVQINAVGTFNVARLVAAAMRETEPDDEGQRGVIVNTASVAAFEGQSGQLAYAAAKAAIAGMTLPMARDLAPLGIRVCSIAPGPMATPALVGVLDRLDQDPTDGIAFPARLGAPDEFAMAVEAIVRNPYLNGETIRLDGALRMIHDSRAPATRA